MVTVSDIRNLGRQLLVICGLRAMHVFNAKFGSLESKVPPNIIFWMKSLLTDPNFNPDCPITSTILLLEHISNFLHDDDAYIRICQELLSAMKNISLQ